MKDDTERFLAGAILVCCGGLLAIGDRVDGMLGAGSVSLRGLELMGVRSPQSDRAVDFVGAAARAIMARWPT